MVRASVVGYLPGQEVDGSRPDALWCDRYAAVLLSSAVSATGCPPCRAEQSPQRSAALQPALWARSSNDDQTRLKNRLPDQTAHPRDHIPVYLHNGNSSASTTTTTSSTTTTTSTSACPSTDLPNLAPIEHPPRPASARRGHDRGGPCHLVLHPRRDDDRRRPGGENSGTRRAIPHDPPRGEQV